MIKKLVATFLLLTTVVFAEGRSLLDWNTESKEYIKIKQDLKWAVAQGKFYDSGIIYADLLDADAFLEVIPQSEGDFSGNILVLVFPDVTKLDKNLVALANRVEKIKVILLEGRSWVKGFNNRSYADFVKKDAYKRLNEVDNIKIERVSVKDKQLKKLLRNMSSNGEFDVEAYRRINVVVGGENFDF